MNKKELKVVLIGQTGSGKSQLGNFILQNEFFKVGNGKSSETEIISEGNTYLDGMSVTIVDTPGLNDTNSKDEEIMDKIVKKFKDDNSIDGIILVYSFRNMRRVQKHQELVNNLLEIFGKDLLEKRLKVIFTNSVIGEERDETDEILEREQMNDAKEFLNYMVMDHEMIFLNTKKKFYDRFRPKIIELLNQIYNIKEKYGSINNALITKKKLKFIEKEKQKEKERMEKELKRQKEEYEREQKKQKEESERRQKELETKMKEKLAMHERNQKEELKRQKEEYERKQKKQKEESERRQKELETKMKEKLAMHERNQKEELERLQKEKRDNLQRKLNDIHNSINYYQNKISEASNNIENLKKEIKERDLVPGIIVCSIAAPLSLGLTGIMAGICAHDKNKFDKQIKKYENDLEYYRTEIDKLRAKEEALKILI